MSALLLGGSGSGKSVTVAIPSILNLGKNGHSMCIHDPSGELYEKTAGDLIEKGYTIKLLDFSEPGRSDGFNPLVRAKNVTDIQKIASLLVRNTLGESKDPFWSTQSTMLITLVARVLQKKNFWFKNLANVKYVIDSMISNPEGIDRIVVECMDRTIVNEYKQFMAMDNKLLTSILSTCRASLALLNDPSVQTTTAYDSIDFESFKRDKVALFICNKTADMKYYSSLSAIYFEQFFGFIMSRLPQKGDKKSIFFILDEASSLYLPTLQIALANLRKFNSGILAIAQDFNQFIHLYGTYEAEALKSNCYSKVYLPGAPLNTAQELEKQLGVFEYEDDKGVRRTRPLMTADEIRVMKPNSSLIIAGPNRAIFNKMYPYFKNPKYRRVLKLRPPERQSNTPFEELPLIPLPTPQPKTERK